MPLAAEEMAAAFIASWAELEAVRRHFIVMPPSYRFDLDVEEDLIEEVARLYGYERIPAQPPLAPARMRAEPRRSGVAPCGANAAGRARLPGTDQLLVRRRRWEADFSDNPEPISVLNPIAAQMSVMRSTLFGGLVARSHTT